MTRFCGEVGYGTTVESPADSGVWIDVITERTYYGDITRVAKNTVQTEHLNPDLSVSNSISIIADAYAQNHFFDIRYVRWGGGVWTVTKVEVQLPRLILSLGSVYNGPTYTAP